MIRLQENVPEIYTKASRDFQLFCRTYDLVDNAVRFNVKSTRTLLDPLSVSDRMLPLLATRVGFFPKTEYNTYALRLIISVFPYMMRWKGTKKAIEIALYTILKAEKHYGKVTISFDNNLDSTIVIYSDVAITNELLLRDVLSYILPIGYDLYIRYSRPYSPKTTQLIFDDSVRYIDDLLPENSSVIMGKDVIEELNSESDQIKHDSVGNYNTTKIIDADDNSSPL